MAILLAGLSSLIYGVCDFAGGKASRRAPVLVVTLWASSVGLVIAIVASLVHHLAVGATPTMVDLAWGGISGVGGAAGLALYFQGMAKGRMAVVAPVSAVTLAVVPILFGVLTGERYGVVSWLGLLLALPALWLTVYQRHTAGSSGDVFYGLAAGLVFSVFLIGIAQTSSEAGLWPLVAVRLGGVSILALLIAVRKAPVVLPKSARPLATLSGGDILANLTYLLAVRIGPLGPVAVASSFYPVVIVVLARAVEKEKLSLSRICGLSLSVVAVTLIAL